jgi:hypothetical protein
VCGRILLAFGLREGRALLRLLWMINCLAGLPQRTVDIGTGKGRIELRLVLNCL